MDATAKNSNGIILTINAKFSQHTTRKMPQIGSINYRLDQSGKWIRIFITLIELIENTNVHDSLWHPAQDNLCWSTVFSSSGELKSKNLGTTTKSSDTLLSASTSTRSVGEKRKTICTFTFHERS